MVAVVIGVALLARIDETTPLWVLAVDMAVLGLGLGATMQNLVLSVQNNAAQADMGAASSLVAFFRSLGGSVGVAALGAVLSHQVSTQVTAGLSQMGQPTNAQQSHEIPDLTTLPAPVRALFQQAFGEATGHLFLVTLPFAVSPWCAWCSSARSRCAPRSCARMRSCPTTCRRPRWWEAVPRAEELGRLEQEVGVLIRRVKRVIGERSRSVHPDLQPASYLMLTYLAAEGPQRSSVLSDRFGVDKGAISRQVQHLCDLGLLVREPDPDDGRATLVSASPDAVHRLEALDRDRRRWLDERLSGWSEDDLRDFVAALARYNATLD